MQIVKQNITAKPNETPRHENFKKIRYLYKTSPSLKNEFHDSKNSVRSTINIGVLGLTTLLTTLLLITPSRSTD